MPSFAGATEWLNSEPLGPAELQDQVVLVNFWTWTCINWVRQAPYVRAWSQAYHRNGLLIIGVHTPEFAFEHEIDGVQRATDVRAIDYPVAVDNDYEIWNAFANRAWPALHFVDRAGHVVDRHYGEGRYEESERLIQELPRRRAQSRQRRRNRRRGGSRLGQPWHARDVSRLLAQCALLLGRRSRVRPAPHL
jgi:thiol-disulfide isomerase/thioredoxin